MKFEDIRAGDTISYTEDGITYTGTAHHKDEYGDWMTEEDAEIAWKYNGEEDKFTLVARPTPEEPANLGAVVSAQTYGGQAEEFVRVSGGASGWYDIQGNNYTWDELKNVTVLHTGWDGETIG